MNRSKDRTETAGDVTVIIRRCGERTQEAAEAVVRQWVAPEQIIRVQTSPFAAALAEGHRRGIEAGRTWTLCLDADVLPNPAALRTMLGVARVQRGDVFEIQGFVADKFFGIHRAAGNHLYRTSTLSRALACIDGGPDDLRPEHHSILRMRRMGFRDLQTPVVVGLHDFEQHPADVHRKCFLHAFKHAADRDYLRQRFDRLSASDDDFRMARRALDDADRYTGAVRVDQNFRRDAARAAVDDLDLGDREPLDRDDPIVRPSEGLIAFERIAERSFEGESRQAELLHHYFGKPHEPSRWQRRWNRWRSKLRRRSSDPLAPPPGVGVGRKAA